MIYLLIVLSFFLGYYQRELLDTIKSAVGKLEHLRGAEEAKKSPSTGFADVMTRAEVVELMEKERIDLLNR